ncbi:recombinase family protein [Novosphingobium olei]|uniref:Recombinase family protein n=1 Tax=Novosphingobium olei TaxID=2728851 RepID=A0A7Y0BSB0_9SPHN|nr:recombinase family protein [Novosphingobium olei]NML95670.1 recombinase family protein [Novosphingobium olei]
MKNIRCAIYTRKSSEEGLEQGFNSLDAQYEACSAYVLSQASEGWQLIPEHFDDGGLSGGTLVRPALQRLLAKIAAGQVDIVVVYKVDRLTRSLLDFSKLVEAFDAHEASFVSVTQSFNTTTSMGRLTLNMLLSFAQFEREVTAERIRDKIAASKAKGMWMGGTPPVGYRPNGRSLAIVDEHADTIRFIFEAYVELGHVRALAEHLSARGIVSPVRARANNGATFGGLPFSRGQLYAILRNPVYTGRVAHRDRIYPGQHTAIIDENLWQRVQAKLEDNRQGRHQTRQGGSALLQGLLQDPHGEPLVATHTTKGKVRYRYYVSRSLHHGFAANDQGIRIPAREIEKAVIQALVDLLSDPFKLASKMSLSLAAGRLGSLISQANETANKLRMRNPALVRELLIAVHVHSSRLDLQISAAQLAILLGLDATSDTAAVFTHAVPVRLFRNGCSLRLVYDNNTLVSTDGAEQGLVRTIARGRQWWKMLCETGLDIKDLASREGVTASWMTRVVRVAFLSPRIIDAALAGTLRAEIGSTDLIGPAAIPRLWEEQELLYLPGT